MEGEDIQRLQHRARVDGDELLRVRALAVGCLEEVVGVVGTCHTDMIVFGTRGSEWLNGAVRGRANSVVAKMLWFRKFKGSQRESGTKAVISITCSGRTQTALVRPPSISHGLRHVKNVLRSPRPLAAVRYTPATKRLTTWRLAPRKRSSVAYSYVVVVHSYRRGGLTQSVAYPRHALRLRQCVMWAKEPPPAVRVALNGER